LGKIPEAKIPSIDTRGPCPFKSGTKTEEPTPKFFGDKDRKENIGERDIIEGGGMISANYNGVKEGGGKIEDEGLWGGCFNEKV